MFIKNIQAPFRRGKNEEYMSTTMWSLFSVTTRYYTFKDYDFSLFFETRRILLRAHNRVYIINYNSVPRKVVKREKKCQ